MASFEQLEAIEKKLNKIYKVTGVALLASTLLITADCLYLINRHEIPSLPKTRGLHIPPFHQREESPLPSVSLLK